MALARAWSVALHGVDGQVVEIEADIGGGLPGVHLLGLPDAALQESRDRVRAAVVNSGRAWPNERIVLALAPATLRKTCSGVDLPCVKSPSYPAMTRRAVVSCRITRDREGAGLGVARQEQDCRDLADRLGWD